MNPHQWTTATEAIAAMPTTWKKQAVEVAEDLEIVTVSTPQDGVTPMYTSQGRGRGHRYKLATIVWLLKSFRNMCSLADLASCCDFMVSS